MKPTDGRESDLITTRSLLRFVRANFWWIAGFALIPALIVACIALFIFPRSYEASAILVSIPPPVSSDLKPNTLSMQGYQLLLESGIVIAETKQRLVAKNILAPGDTLRLKENLDSQIFISRKEEAISLTPMLRVLARAELPDHAALIANTWTAVFMDRIRSLVTGSTLESIDFVEKEFPIVRGELEKLEVVRVQEQDHSQSAQDSAASDWDLRILDWKVESTKRIADFEVETSRILEEIRTNRKLDLLNTELDSLKRTYSTLADERTGVEARLVQKRRELDALRQLLADTPPFVTLERSVTEDALWQTLLQQPEKEQLDEISKVSLKNQEINPLHTELAMRVSQIQTESEALTPRKEQLAVQLDQISKEIASLQKSVGDCQLQLEEAKQNRSAGLSRLREEVETKLTHLKRSQQQALDVLKRQHTQQIDPINREIDRTTQLFSSLASYNNQALLAKGTRDFQDLRIAAPAVASDIPQSRNVVVKSMIALVIGAFVGILVCLVRNSQ